MTNQYRITVEGQSSGVLSTYPGAQWATAAENCEARGLNATFERRLITDLDILDLVPNAQGYIRIGNRVACPWEVIAEMRMQS